MATAKDEQNQIRHIWFYSKDGELYLHLEIACDSPLDEGAFVFQDFAVGLVTDLGFEAYGNPLAKHHPEHNYGPNGWCEIHKHPFRITDKEVMAEVKKLAKEYVSG
ncbi:MAG: hypothetical protein WD231_00970 [Candidatus Woykebacteria bacterium]